jgi:hypothetical protein
VHSDTCRLRLPILQRASLRKGRTGSERIRAPSGRTDSECTFSRTQASATNIRPSSYSGVAGFESSAPERPMRPAGFRAASGRQWTLATGAESQPSSVCVRSRIFCDFRPRSRMSINQYVSGPIVQKRTIPSRKRSRATIKHCKLIASKGAEAIRAAWADPIRRQQMLANRRRGPHLEESLRKMSEARKAWHSRRSGA